MGVNPPAPENFIDDDNKVTATSPNAVYLQDVDAAKLEIYRSKVEKRKPDFKGIPDNAVRAAGYTPKGKPLPDRGPGAPLVTPVEQTPIITDNLQPNTAPPEADPVAKGLANAPKAAPKAEAPKVEAPKVDAPKKTTNSLAKKAAAARKSAK